MFAAAPSKCVSHWGKGLTGKAGKSRKSWGGKKGVGDELSAKDQFLYDPGQTKLIPSLNFEQGI